MTNPLLNLKCILCGMLGENSWTDVCIANGNGSHIGPLSSLAETAYRFRNPVITREVTNQIRKELKGKIIHSDMHFEEIQDK